MSRDRILIIAITRMGDLLQCSPTIVGLKKQYPNSKITILVDNQFAKICEGIPGIDEIKKVDMNFLASGIWNGGEALVESYEYVDNLVADLKSGNFDFCINMSNSTYTAILIKMLNVKESTGWLADDRGFRLMADKWAMLFTSCIYHSNRSYNNLNLVDYFRCASKVTQHPRTLVYNVDNESREIVDKYLKESFTEQLGPLICIQVGASQEKRQWAPRKFALLARYLVEDLNARVVYTGAPAESQLVEEALNNFKHKNVTSSVGKTTIPQLGALLEKADLLITGDTGPMHLSVAVGTPVVALFLASALCFETGPYSKGNIVLQPQISCNPCNPNFPCARPDCHDQISPELVSYLAKLRLQNDSSKDPFLTVPQDIAPPSQVRIFISDFDQEGFLNFYPINGKEESDLNPEEPNDIARLAHRRLWKEELGGYIINDDIDVENAHSISLSFNEAVDRCKEECQDALNELELLIKVASDPKYPASMLGDISKRLSQIERNLEEISLTFPILGTIVRIFIIDKENIRGEDIFYLTQVTKSLYQDLERRLEKFRKYFVAYQKQILNLEDIYK